ncbi:MAG: aminoacyltransferase [Candidatus Methanoperedenaceae archaeon]|nr:aminoacyltransferase [Candidatus Methanoperedenaceae archaeon]
MIIRIASWDDGQNWDSVVDNCSKSTYSHTWGWKELLRKELNVENLSLVAKDNGKIIGIYTAFITHSIKRKYIYKLINYDIILSSPYELTWDYGGPCLLDKFETDDLKKELILKMEDVAKEKNAISIKISPFDDEQLKTILVQNGYRISPRLTSIIDLKPDIENLISGFKSDVKKGIKRSERDGVVVIEVQASGLKDAYNCLSTLHNSLDVYLPPFNFFNALYDTFLPKKMVKFFVAYLGDKPIASSVCLYFNKICTERYRGSNPEYRKLYPDNALVWNSIIDAKKNGCEIFDFGGLPSDENNGIYLYKVRWGGTTKKIDWYIKDLKFNRLRKMYRSIKKKIANLNIIINQ